MVVGGKINPVQALAQGNSLTFLVNLADLDSELDNTEIVPINSLVKENQIVKFMELRSQAKF